MNRAQITKSRRLHRVREVKAYREWRRLVRTRKTNDPARKRAFARYVKERDARRHRDRQLRKFGVAHVGNRGLALIKSFEGFRTHPYRDAVGVATIGYGHTEGVTMRSHSITKTEGTALLHRDLDRKYFPAVKRALPRHTFNRLTQNQVDALVSFAYNLGPGYLEAGHDMGDALRAGNMHRAADAFLLYDRAGGRRLAGLTRRRKAERKLFTSK